MEHDRAILHSDLNSFYASVEMMLDPGLRGKAVAVCGSTESRHGIVLAKSELAKKAGVKTGMVNWEARQCCRDLIMVPPHYDQYLKYSSLTRAIYERFTDLVEPFGMDECWLDITDSGAFGDSVAMIRADSRTYEDAFTRNYERWNNMADKSALDYELNREAFACRSEAESAEQLAHWLERRIEFLNGVWHR